MAMDLYVQKKIPASDRYTGSGLTSINLRVIDFTVNTKRSLIKTPIPQSPSTQNANQSDLATNFVLDLKRVEETIKLRCILEDDDSETAWNKAWKLRSMCTSGNIDGDYGALNSLKIDNVEFTNSTQRAFVEEVTFIARNSGAANKLSDNAGKGIGRIELDLTIYLGDSRT